MKFKWTAILAAVVSVLALSAVAAAGALASTPQFELKEGQTFPIKFSDTNHAAPVFESPSEATVKCKEESVEGEITSATTVGKVVETLTGCKSNIFGTGTCKNSGTETIKTASLKGTLGYIDEATGQVGLELEGETTGPEKEPLWAEFDCNLPAVGESAFVVEGEVFSSINAEHQKFNEKVTLSYTQTKGVQKITGFEGASPKQLKVKDVLGKEKLGVSTESALGMLPTGETVAIDSGPPHFELEGGSHFPIKFASTGRGAMLSETAAGVDLTCGEEKVEGEITSATAISKVVKTLGGCKSNLERGSAACENTGTETIVTASMKGSLGYLNKTTDEVGLKLEGETSSGGEPLWAEFKCGASPVKVTGYLYAFVKGKFGLFEESLTPIYSQSLGNQAVNGFEGGTSGNQLHMHWAFNEKLGITTEELPLFWQGGHRVAIIL